MTFTYNPATIATGMKKQLTVKQFAKKVGLTPRTIQREIRRGNIYAKKVGNRFVIDYISLQRYLKKQEIDEVDTFITNNKRGMVDLLQELVTIPSESEQVEKEELLAKRIKKFLDKHSIRTVISGKGESITLQATYGYADKGIMLNCPLDTTPAGNNLKWKYPPFDGVIRNGCMYGRGTADSKGGMICMMYTLLALKKFVREENIRVEVIFDGGEHSGAYHGMREAVKRGLDIECGIIGYGGDQKDIQIGARGYHRYTIRTRGAASHTGSRTRYGINAITQMAKLIIEIEKNKFPSKKDKLFFFGSRLTFSEISGGQAINIVPDECEARVDVRTLPYQNKGTVDQYFSNIFKKLSRRDKNFKAKIQYLLGEDGYVLKKDNKVITSLQKVLKTNLEKNVPLAVSGPSHIGAFLYKHNIPVIIWGPKGGNVHAYDEYVEIDSLSTTVQTYVDFVREYFGI